MECKFGDSRDRQAMKENIDQQFSRKKKSLNIMSPRFNITVKTIEVWHTVLRSGGWSEEVYQELLCDDNIPQWLKDYPWMELIVSMCLKDNDGWNENVGIDV